MVLPGHLAGGFLSAKAVLFLAGAIFTPFETAVILIIGIISGEGPDMDVLKFYFDRNKTDGSRPNGHRDYITHAPIVWILFSAVVYLLGIIFSNNFIAIIGLTILIGSMSHFIFDSIEYRIRWLWPFSNRTFSLKPKPEPAIDLPPGTLPFYWTFIRKYYIKTWTFYLEIIVFSLAIWVAFQ